MIIEFEKYGFLFFPFSNFCSKNIEYLSTLDGLARGNGQILPNSTDSPGELSRTPGDELKIANSRALPPFFPGRQ